MAGLTENGLEIKRFDELQDDVQQSLIASNTGLQISSNSESAANNIFNPILLALAELWELGQSVNNNYDVYKAEGVHLDELVGLNKVVRLKPKNSNGIIEIITSTPQEVQVGSLFIDNLNRRVITGVTVTTNFNAGSYVKASLPTVTDGTSYVITIAGTIYSSTASATSTPNTVIDDLVFLATGDTFADVSNVDDNLIINVKGSSNTTLSISTQFSLQEIGSFVTATSVDEGALVFSENSVLTPVAVIPNFIRSSLPASFETGRLLETDEELRTRFLSSGSVLGNATIPNIKAKLLSVPDVKTVTLTENRTTTTVGSLPPHSFSCLVFGGTDNAVGDAIFRSKPAGIATYGTTTVQVTDDEGDSHSISFLRPVEVFVYVKVEYSLYAEESFPLDGEDLIATAITTRGNSDQAGVDILPDRFIGTAFSATQGMSTVSISVFTSNSAILDPNVQVYSSAPLVIDNTQTASYDASRIIFNRV